jgi:basic amino acid/polyamine antiporter, APA family
MTRTSSQPGRKLGLLMCVALVMGNMIGSGIFLLPASLAPFGWNGIAGWAISIAGALALAFVLARLTEHLPAAEGPVGFVEAAFGRLPAFFIGWSYWVSIWTAMVTIAVAAVGYLAIFVPVLKMHAAIGTVALIWLVTAINLLGARSAGQFQLVTLLLKLVPLMVVIGVIIVTLARQGTAMVQPLPAEGLSLSAANASALLALWALLGFESASLAADKVEEPRRIIPRATLIGTMATGLLYLIVCAGIVLMLPTQDLAQTTAPFELFIATFWAREPAVLIAGFAAISALGTLNGWCLMQAELPAAMARRGILPAFLALENRRLVPVRALLISSIVATIFVCLNSGKSTGDLFRFMATLSTSATLWLYLACAAAALRFRLVLPIAAAAFIYAIWTLWGAGPEVSAMSFILMAAGLPFYLWAQKSRTAHQSANQ